MLKKFNELVKRVVSRFEKKKKHSVLTINHGDAMKWFERRRNEYDRLITAVSPYVSNDAIIFDIGSNIGYFTLLLTERLNFKGSAYCFEPVPHLAELCKTTFSNAPFEVTVFNFGLGDRNTWEYIFLAADGNIGWNTLVSEKTSRKMTKIRIQLKTFDTSGVDVIPSFIKIDVEGAEHSVFQGMLVSLRKWHSLPVVLCEIGWGERAP